MRIKPILFSTPMVQAITAGRKTQTRRIIKNIPDGFTVDGNLWTRNRLWDSDIEENPNPIGHFLRASKDGEDPIEFKSKYNRGDVLWVRETWNRSNNDQGPTYKYKEVWDSLEMAGDFHGKPSIHMPFHAARLFIKVRSVRAEKLQDISEADAISEGIQRHGEQYADYMISKKILNILGTKFNYYRPENSFRSLWESIHGTDSWAINPLVFVYDLELINTESGICFLCGCTEDNCSVCFDRTGYACHWLNASRTICSACKTKN